jgi:hypothetical protein
MHIFKHQSDHFTSKHLVSLDSVTDAPQDNIPRFLYFQTCGRVLDTPKAKPLVDQYFDR